MVFKKGQLPVNPGGLTPRERAARFRLQGLSIKAIDKLEEILDTGTNQEKLVAAKEVLDRALGKAKIHANIDVSHSTTGHLDALVAIAAQTAQRVGHIPQIAPQIEGQVIDITDTDTYQDNKQHVDARSESAHKHVDTETKEDNGST